MVDLLQQHHDGGRRFEPTELVEAGQRVAVGLQVRDQAVEVFKVFTFREPDDRAVLLQDCVDRDDALGYLAAVSQ